MSGALRVWSACARRGREHLCVGGRLGDVEQDLHGGVVGARFAEGRSGFVQREYKLRSRRGFLERLHDGDETIVMVCGRPGDVPSRGVLADLGLPAQMLEHALFLNNMMYDPREIHDLLHEAGMSRREVTTHLTEAYLGALRGWARAG